MTLQAYHDKDLNVINKQSYRKQTYDRYYIIVITYKRLFEVSRF